MTELINTLLNYVLTTQYGQYTTMFVLLMFIVNQILPHLPVRITSKIPNFVMIAINAISGRYKNTQNKLTDIKGNAK
jgi:hypothetical protein